LLSESVAILPNPINERCKVEDEKDQFCTECKKSHNPKPFFLKVTMTEADHENRCRQNSREICKKEGYPLLITEWSASYSSRDAVHDSYYSAPFILSTLKECEGYADMMSYWTYTDIFEEVGPAEKPFHGGFGLINMQSLPKPSFYAYEFLGKLGKNRLECDDKDAYVCRSDSEMQILFWNLVHPDQDLPNSEYFSKPCEAKKIDDAKIEISGLESNRKYNISVETIGYKSGDVYNAYLDRNFTELPTREEIKELIERSVPKKTICVIKSNNEGKVTLTVPQSENQVDLVRISL